MSKVKTFDCPSCHVPMTFRGGESLFQNCEACLAPIVIPDEIFYKKSASLAYSSFASLNNDKDVNVESVTNELTMGDSLPETSIADSLGFDVVIEKFDEYQEKIISGAVAEKQAFDSVVSSGDNDFIKQNSLLELTPREEQSATMDLIRQELRTGDKVEAIKIYRETFGVDLKSAKDYIEKLEKGILRQDTKE